MCSIDGQMTFPGNDPGPSNEEMAAALESTDLPLQPYTGPKPVVEWELQKVTVSEEVKVNIAKLFMDALKQAWTENVPGKENGTHNKPDCSFITCNLTSLM